MNYRLFEHNKAKKFKRKHKKDKQLIFRIEKNISILLKILIILVFLR